MQLNNAGALDPATTLLAAILAKAKTDAERGDLGALAWLIHTGGDVADAITPGASNLVLNFCREVWRRIEHDNLKTIWRIEE